MATVNPGMFAGLTYGTAMKNKDLDKAASEVSNGKSVPNEDWLDPRDKRSTYRASGMDQTPVQTSFNTPYEQYASQQIGSLGDAYSDRAASFARGVAADAYAGMGNTDEQSNERYQKLAEREAELKKEIAKLSADIAYQRKLRAIEMKNDPMWDIAKQQYILKGDSSGLENIMSRMEAEKGREATENIAKMNKAAEDKSKQDAAMESYERQKEVYNYLKSKVAKLAADDPSRPEAVDNLKGAEIALKYAARRAGMEDEFTELSRVEEADLAEKTAKLSMFFRSAGVDSPESFKSLYESADDEQKRRMLNDAKLLGLSDKDLGITGAAAKDELKQEQKKKQDEKTKAAKKKKNDFKNANIGTTFEMNGLTGKPLNEQEWVDFQNKAKDSGWTGLTLQTNGTILWP